MLLLSTRVRVLQTGICRCLDCHYAGCLSDHVGLLDLARLFNALSMLVNRSFNVKTVKVRRVWRRVASLSLDNLQKFGHELGFARCE